MPPIFTILYVYMVIIQSEIIDPGGSVHSEDNACLSLVQLVTFLDD